MRPGSSRSCILAPSLATLAVLLSLGCPADEPSATTGEGSSSGGAGGSTSGPAGSTSAVDGSDDATTGGAGSTAGPEDSETTADGGSTGEPSTPCELGCTQLAACGKAPLEGCISECEDFFDQIEGFEECEQAEEALWICFGEAPCDELERHCAAEIEAEYLACEEGLSCTQEVDGAIDGSTCTITQVCGDGLDRALECEQGTCSCIDAGMVTGSCAQDTLCGDLADLPLERFEETVDAFLLECCGWDPPTPPGEG